MNTTFEIVNSAGKAFIEFALPMLVQSCILILILLLTDFFLRKKVRAIFRYWIWMLVLVKLILPTSLSSPLSIGYLFGDKLISLPATPTPPEQPKPPATITMPIIDLTDIPQDLHTQPAPTVTSRPEPIPAQPIAPPPVPPAALSWQGIVFLLWLAVVIAMTLLLLQRAIFVQGLVAQAGEADSSIKKTFDSCCEGMGIRKRIGLKVSTNATSPAVCGLFRPVILLPHNLSPGLSAGQLQSVLLHELAHIKRGGLWINLAQTVLQIVYFYNPLLWIANTIIRRIREQAVDETVLVAMGQNAKQYPQTLVDVAKLAFKRPVLSLRLIGVVESKSALAGRIKRILSRPIPKKAKLGILSLLAVIIIAAILLPMAKAKVSDESRFNVGGGPLDIQLLGVRPDAGDDIYDAEGKKLEKALGPIGLWEDPWGSDKQRRDFIFELPAVDKQVLFDRWHHLYHSGTNTGLGVGRGWSLGRSGKQELFILMTTFKKTYLKRTAYFFTRQVPVHKVDLELRYFCGPPLDPVCTFSGPFAFGTKTFADGGLSYELTPEKFEPPFSESHIRFRFSGGRELGTNPTVIIYDTSGSRHLMETVGLGKNGLVFEHSQLPLDKIAAITVGEKPHERTFRNIVVDYPDRPVREYPEYLDRMADILGITNLSKEELSTYRFKDPNEAIAVIGIVRGRGHTASAVEALMFGKPAIDISGLEPQVHEKIRHTANIWASAVDPRMKARGVQLGLIGRWPEFFEQALEILSNDYQYLPLEDVRILKREVGYIVWILLNRYRERLTAEQVQRLQEYHNGQRGLPVLAPQVKTDVQVEVEPVGQSGEFHDAVPDYSDLKAAIKAAYQARSDLLSNSTGMAELTLVKKGLSPGVPKQLENEFAKEFNIDRESIRFTGEGTWTTKWYKKGEKSRYDVKVPPPKEKDLTRRPLLIPRDMRIAVDPEKGIYYDVLHKEAYINRPPSRAGNPADLVSYFDVSRLYEFCLHDVPSLLSWFEKEKMQPQCNEEWVGQIRYIRLTFGDENLDAQGKKDKRRFELWIAPEMSYSLVKARAFVNMPSLGDQLELVESYEATYQESDNFDGIWLLKDIKIVDK